MSDKPGTYAPDVLAKQLKQYLSQSLWSAQRMRKVLFPVLLRDGKVSREQLKNEFVEFGEADNARDAGYFLTLISSQIGMAKNDFLRQVIGFEVPPDRPWRKETYFIRDEYRNLVQEVMNELSAQSQNA